MILHGKSAGGLVAVLSLLIATVVTAAEPERKTSNAGVDEALNTIADRNNVSKERFRVDPAALDLEMTYSGRFRLQSYVMQEPYRAPGVLEALSRNLTAGEGISSRLEALARLARRVEGRAPRGPAVLPEETQRILESNTPVEDAIERVYEGTKKRFQGKDREEVIKEERSLPPAVARELARLILATLDATVARNAVIKDSDFRRGGLFDSRSKRTAEELREFVASWWEDDTETNAFQVVEPALDSFDLNSVYRAAVSLARSLDDAATACRAPGFAAGARPEFQFEWFTPLGRYAVGGEGENHYNGDYSLILDLGGNDEYRGAGAVSGLDPVAVVLDLGGDDRYEPADSARAAPGGAVLGYAAIVDLGESRDTYVGTSWGEGFGFLGVGMIRDDGGDDVYDMQWLGQGTGIFGLGLLLDEGGADAYRVVRNNSQFLIGRSQGFGGPSGMGALVDLEGGDEYLFGDEGASQDTPAFVQGASSGVGTYRAGGLGLLVDGGGSDTYGAGAWAQGAARGCGLGGLIDLGGDDRYQGMGHTQGTGAAMGVGILVDTQGADRYEAHASSKIRTRDSTLGAGTHLGLGMFVDVSGPDVYEAGEVALGSSSDNGAGWFLDFDGDDTYTLTDDRCMAFVEKPGADPWQAGIPAAVLFVDLGRQTKRFPAWVEALQRGSENGFFAPHGEGTSLGGGVAGNPPVASDSP